LVLFSPTQTQTQTMIPLPFNQKHDHYRNINNCSTNKPRKAGDILYLIFKVKGFAFDSISHLWRCVLESNHFIVLIIEIQIL
jgi:hypothetical protein